VDTREIQGRVERFVTELELIPPGGEVTALVSGGADSTALWHILRALGYRVSALHVNHHLRGAESDEDARFCADQLGAEVVDAPPSGRATEEHLRDLRYAVAPDKLRATGHTASDQAETILYRLVSSGRPSGIKPKREDGVVRPLLPLWREETKAYCAAVGLDPRQDSSNPETKRGLIRDQILPLLRELHPAAEQNLLALATEPPRLPRGLENTLRDLLATSQGTKTADLGQGIQAVREYDRVSLEQGAVRWGPWLIESDDPALEVRARKPGDRLAGRSKKIQDVLVDAKVPRRERDAYPLVVRDDEVVAVPGIVETPGVRARRLD
jgi:tRNA(Ile)-lysidine synthetase-like protein